MATAEVKRWWVVAVVLLSAALVSAVVSVRQRAALPHAFVQQVLPNTIGSWKTVHDITFQDSIIQVLGTNDVTGRAYADAQGRAVSVVIVRAVNNRSAFHPPEYCLTGGGNSIIDRAVQPMLVSSGAAAGLNVNEMHLRERNGVEFLVWNWYGASGRMTENFYAQQWFLLLDRMMSGRSDGVVVNLYADVMRGNTEPARAACRDFAGALMPYIVTSLTDGER